MSMFRWQHRQQFLLGASTGSWQGEPWVSKRFTATVQPARAYTITDSGTLDGEESQAEAINGSGQILGIATTADWDNRAFLWQDGAMMDLGTLNGEREAMARAINEAGPNRRLDRED